jgi:hypothetical protein
MFKDRNSCFHSSVVYTPLVLHEHNGFPSPMKLFIETGGKSLPLEKSEEYTFRLFLFSIVNKCTHSQLEQISKVVAVPFVNCRCISFKFLFLVLFKSVHRTSQSENVLFPKNDWSNLIPNASAGEPNSQVAVNCICTPIALNHRFLPDLGVSASLPDDIPLDNLEFDPSVVKVHQLLVTLFIFVPPLLLFLKGEHFARICG